MQRPDVNRAVFVFRKNVTCSLNRYLDFFFVLLPKKRREGKIVPAEVTVRLLRMAMETSGKSRFLIDGFPRNPENLAAWEASTADGSAVVDFALFLDCPEEVNADKYIR